MAEPSGSVPSSVSTWLDNIKKLFGLICSAMPAIAISLFNYEETRIDRLKRENEAMALQLKLKENADAITQKFAGLSDVDIVRQSIADGGGPNDNATLSGTDPVAAPTTDPGPGPAKS